MNLRTILYFALPVLIAVLLAPSARAAHNDGMMHIYFIDVEGEAGYAHREPIAPVVAHRHRMARF